MSLNSNSKKIPPIFGLAHSIETKRLSLRPYVAEDWERVHIYASIPAFSQFDVWGPNDVEDTKRFIAEAITNLKAQSVARCDLAVVLKDENLLIGGVSLKQNAEASLGYSINPSFQGKGYATEAAFALIEFGFIELGLSNIYAQCDTRNIASRCVMVKAGMKLVTVLKDHRKIDGFMTDSYRYEIRRP